jgi:hypothetical protein
MRPSDVLDVGAGLEERRWLLKRGEILPVSTKAPSAQLVKGKSSSFYAFL